MTEDQQQEPAHTGGKGKGGRRINWFLVLLLVAPFALLIAREFSRGGLIGYMRVADVGDLLILSPLYAVIMIYLLFFMARYQAPARHQPGRRSVRIAVDNLCLTPAAANV